jgi:hypothetical protein
MTKGSANSHYGLKPDILPGIEFYEGQARSAR